MKRSLRLLVLAGVVGVASAGCADRQPMRTGATGQGAMMGAPASSASQQMHQGMMRGMQQMQGMQLTGDADKDFVRMMRMHHMQGIEMARIELQKGDDAEARQMAQKIIEQQAKEIAEFDRWLQRNN